MNITLSLFVFTIFAFLVLNIIHHLIIIEQLKKVKRNQNDTIDYLDAIDDDMLQIYDELKDINQSINNIAYTNRNK